MRLARRSLGEEFLYGRGARRDRGGRRPSAEHGQPPSPERGQPPGPERRLNLILRYVGIILPLAVGYGLGLFYFGARDNDAGFLVSRVVAAALWVGFAAALAARRDLIGAFVVTASYIFFVGWMWLAVTD